MEATRQFLSPTRQAEIGPFETAERPTVGFARDYVDGLTSGFHSHPRAQLLYAVSGVMRVQTRHANFVVPPTTALYVPAHEEHSVSMDGAVAMRELFIEDDVAKRIGADTKVIAVSNLLRELIVAICNEPVEWEKNGRAHHLSELAIDEISKASPLPLALRLPEDLRMRRVVLAILSDPGDPRGLEAWCDIANASSRTLARLFRNETGLTFRQWRQQARLTEALRALMTGSTPTKAASIAGYSSVPAFGAAFREVFGITPAQAKAHRTVD